MPPFHMHIPCLLSTFRSYALYTLVGLAVQQQEAVQAWVLVWKGAVH